MKVPCTRCPARRHRNRCGMLTRAGADRRRAGDTRRGDHGPCGADPDYRRPSKPAASSGRVTTAAIASRVMAPVIDVRVRAGDHVRRGAPLVVLDAREMTANRDRARRGCHRRTGILRRGRRRCRSRRGEPRAGSRDAPAHRRPGVQDVRDATRARSGRRDAECRRGTASRRPGQTRVDQRRTRRRPRSEQRCRHGPDLLAAACAVRRGRQRAHRRPRRNGDSWRTAADAGGSGKLPPRRPARRVTRRRGAGRPIGRDQPRQRRRVRGPGGMDHRDAWPRSHGSIRRRTRSS